jgi:hypothetical protein
MLVHVRTFAPHHIREVWGEDERSALALNAEFLLEISQEVTKVNVEQVAGSRDLRREHGGSDENTQGTTAGARHHNVVVVTVADAEEVRHDAVPCAAQHERLFYGGHWNLGDLRKAKRGVTHKQTRAALTTERRTCSFSSHSSIGSSRRAPLKPPHSA